VIPGSRWLLALGLLAACGGGGEEPRSGAEGPRGESPRGEGPRGGEEEAAPGLISMSLVDPQPWSDMLGSGTRYRIQVRTTAGVDTVAGITTPGPPVVAEDVLHGFAIESDGRISSGFIYDARTRRLLRVDLPPDFTGFTAYALRPDGGMLAYVGRAEDGVRLAGIVRRWPGGELVYRGGPAEGYPSDDVNSEVEWLTRDSVDIRLRLNDVETEGGSWLRARGVPGWVMTADTVRGEGD